MRRLVLITNGLLMALLCPALSCSDTYYVASDEVMNCEGEHVTATLEDVEAKVVDTNFSLSYGNENHVGRYCLTIGKDVLKNERLLAKLCQV